LTPQNDAGIQKAALAALRRSPGAGTAKELLQNWRDSSINQRQEIVNVLFSRQEWIAQVLQAIENKALSTSELGTVQRQKLLNHSSPAISERAAKLFAASDADRQKVVQSYKGVSEMKGDPKRGHQLFVQNCSICHRVNGEGQSVGPDLGTVANKPVEELLVAILDPNQAVDPAYTGYSVETKDDREFSGILIAETPNGISLRMPGGAEEQVLRSNLRALKASGRSLMPEGFEAVLKPQEMADLISFILAPKPTP
jgi:putative heme-binding domain-containing protein